MKVYIVFKYYGSEDFMEKAFDNEEKALKYCETMDKVSECGWYYVPMEVEE